MMRVSGRSRKLRKSSHVTTGSWPKNRQSCKNNNVNLWQLLLTSKRKYKKLRFKKKVSKNMKLKAKEALRLLYKTRMNVKTS
jgi:hypothetical protein